MGSVGGQQVVVSRLEGGSGRLAMRITEPMLSLIKRHTLRTCTLDRDTNAALPVLTMVLVTRATGTAAASPPQSAVSRPAAAAPKQAPASVPATASKPAPNMMMMMMMMMMMDLTVCVTPVMMYKTGVGASARHLKLSFSGKLAGYLVGQLATLFEDARVKLPMLLLLRCHINGVLQPYEQRASLRSQGHDTALWLKDPMLSLMRGRRTLLWSLTPAQGGAGSLPEMTVELGDYLIRRRPPPASQTQPSKRTVREAGSGDHTASESSDGGTAVAGNTAHRRTTRKRRADDTNSGTDSADAPPAKKSRSRSRGRQLPSGAAKRAQKRKVPSEQPRVTTSSAFRGVTPRNTTGPWEARLWDKDTKRNVNLGQFRSEEEAARAYDRAKIVFNGTEEKTNFHLTEYAQELPQLRTMTREEVVAHVRDGSTGFICSRGAPAKRGVKQLDSGRWQTRLQVGGRLVLLGTYDTIEVAARVWNFAVLSVRGVDTVTATNFDKGSYLGADGALLPVKEAKQLKKAKHAAAAPAAPAQAPEHPPHEDVPPATPAADGPTIDATPIATSVKKKPPSSEAQKSWIKTFPFIFIATAVNLATNGAVLVGCSVCREIYGANSNKSYAAGTASVYSLNDLTNHSKCDDHKDAVDAKVKKDGGSGSCFQA
ncbi:hypothetical protein FOA52_001352 [Chlamydomonas sp. UWO 241]|nr:hypothetical protein FOA52_001352 [Chlamydomonas sp. UWO 241]